MSKSMRDEFFEQASDAALETYKLLANAKMYAGMSNYAAAKKCLGEIVKFIRLHSEELTRHEERLASAADGPFRVGEQHYSSAHNATDLLWARLDCIVRGDEKEVSHFFEQWGINLSALRVGIIRERSKLFGQQPQTTLAKGDGQQLTKDGMSLDAKALAVFIEHNDWTKKRIAEQIGCNEKSLAPKRCPNLDRAIRTFRAKPEDLPKGSKGADGSMESFSTYPRTH